MGHLFRSKLWNNRRERVMKQCRKPFTVWWLKSLKSQPFTHSIVLLTVFNGFNTPVIIQPELIELCGLYGSGGLCEHGVDGYGIPAYPGKSAFIHCIMKMTMNQWIFDRIVLIIMFKYIGRRAIVIFKYVCDTHNINNKNIKRMYIRRYLIYVDVHL